MLIFLHDDCKLSHGNINIHTVFVDSKTCDWKLACLEFVQSVQEEQTHLPGRYLPACQRYELTAKKQGENQKYESDVLIIIISFHFRSRDVWLVGTLIWEIFNGSGTPNYRQIGSIPRPLSAAYGELVNPNPSIRNSLEKLLQSAFIQNNSLVECLLFLEQIQVGQIENPSRNKTNRFVSVERSRRKTDIFHNLTRQSRSISCAYQRKKIITFVIQCL